MNHLPKQTFSNCRKQLLLIRLVLCFTLLAEHAVAQDTISNFRLYTDKDGLGSNFINTLLLDSKGFLWAGTGEGVFRFDGSSFSTMINSTEDFDSRNITCITQVNDSIILVGTSAAGVLVFNMNHNRFENDRLQDTVLSAGSTTYVKSIVALPKGNCLISAGNHLSLLDKTLRVIQRKYVAGAPNQVYFIPKSPSFLNKDSNRIVIGIPEMKEFNIATFQEAKLSGAFHLVNDLYNTGSWSFYTESDSTLLNSPWDKGLNYFKNGIYHKIVSKDIIDQTRQIYKDPQNSYLFWIATGKGLGLFDERTMHFSFINITGETRLRKLLNSCRDVLLDKYRNVWIATESGLVKLSGMRTAFQDFSLSSKQVLFDIDDAVSDKKGRLWLSFWGNNIVQANKNGNVLMHYNERNDGTGHFGEELQLIADTLYVATSTGTFYFDEKKKRFMSVPFYIPDSLKKGGDKLVFKDSHQNWWIGFYGRGLYRYNALTRKSNFYTSFRPYSSPEFLEILYPTTMAEDRWGNLWMGRNSYSATFTKWDWRSEKFTVIPLRLPGFTLRRCPITQLTIDNDDQVWICIGEYGVLRYDIKTGQWTQFNKSNGLKTIYVNSLAFDREGNLWAATHNGLSVLYKGQNQFVTFLQEDGLPFAQIFWAGFPNQHNDSLLLTGYDKFAWLDVRQLHRRADTPRVSIQSVYINNEPFVDACKRSFPHTESSFRFLFTSVNLQNSNNIYSYRLRGAGKDWIEIGKQHEVSFNNLAPGHYVFEVKARNAEGLWSLPASYTFTINPPFWQTWWFDALIACTLLTAAYSLYRYRVNKIIALYHIRSRISRDLHDEVGSTLSSITIMNELAKANANGNKALAEKIGDNLQKVQNAMQDIVWAVNPKNDYLEHLLLRFSAVAQDMLEPKGIAFQLNGPVDTTGFKLSMERRREIYLVYKECLNNIVKYADCTAVSIRLTVAGQLLSLIISDNGKGFDPCGRHSGNGLRNMQERASAMKGTVAIQSIAGSGTEVELRVPLTQ